MKTIQLRKLLVTLGLPALSTVALAQNSNIPYIWFERPDSTGFTRVYEGNGPDRALIPFRLVFSAPLAAPVTFKLSALDGPALPRATGGTPTTPGADFFAYDQLSYTVPVGSTAFNFVVQVFPDSNAEQDENLYVRVSDIVGATPLEAEFYPNLINFAKILDDDGPPDISINDIKVSEPLESSRSATFKVSLEYPYRLPVSVNFATRNGTARANAPLFPGGPILIGDYVSKSGVLTIPANSANGIITVSLNPDFNQIDEPDETFFVDLSNAVNGTIRDSSGIGTILDTTPAALGFVPITGGFQISPDLAAPVPGETVIYSIIWEVPEGEVWRDFDTIDFRIRDKKKTALWVRWDETTNLFTLLNTPKHGKKGDQEVASALRANGIVVGDLAGSNVVLEGALAELDLAESSVVGSGPTGKTVTLNLAVRFLDKAEGRSFDLELAATDDFLNEDGFIQADKVEVKRIVPSGPK